MINLKALKSLILEYLLTQVDEETARDMADDLIEIIEDELE